MALSFDFRWAVLPALFLLGAWASQAAAQETYKGHVNKANKFKIIEENLKFSDYHVRPERPIKPPRYKSDNNNGADPEVEPTTETPLVSSSPAAPTTTTTPVQSSTSIPESVDRIKDGAQMADSIVHSGTNGKAMFTHTMIFIAIIIALSHATI